MNKTWNSCTKVLCIICFLYSSALFFGCSSKELPPSEVIEIETIEILDLDSDKKSPQPSAAEQEVQKARTARQSADEAKAAAEDATRLSYDLGEAARQRSQQPCHAQRLLCQNSRLVAE